MKKNLPKVGFAIIMIAFAYLTTVLVTRNIPLNLATWLMWVVIDTALLVSIISAGNKRPWCMIGFETGACVITAIAVIKLVLGQGQWSWGSTESLAALCVISALIVWKQTSGVVGIVSITAAMYVAMIPTFVNQWQNPVGQDPIFWGACSLGCALEFIGKPKSISQAFFPACGTVFNGLAMVLSFRQYFW